MNFKKTWKRANEGFTLVELIVVIAILAILAGVAVPAYSGYIKKANEAADQQVLGAVNTAFAAACLDEGIDFNAVTTARLATSGSDALTINGVTGVSASEYTVPADFSETFMFYLSGNPVLKAIGQPQFVPGVGFKKNDGQIVSGNMTAAQIQDAVNRYYNSNLVGNEDVLAQNFGAVSSELSNRIANGLNLGMFMGGNEAYAAFREQYGLTDESTSTEIANALIMDTASKTQGVTAQDIVNLAGEGFNNMAAVQEQYGEIASSAMMYGVMAGYANSEYASDTFKTSFANTPSGLGDVENLLTQMMTDERVNEYLGNTGANGAVADLDGYLAAMEVINGHSGSFDLTKSDAFTNDETMELLESLLGNK